MLEDWEYRITAMRKAIAENKLTTREMRALIGGLRKMLAYYERSDEPFRTQIDPGRKPKLAAV
jgi:hypothetical protein